MIPSPDNKRPICPTCLRPQTACICRWIVNIRNDVDVLILQHPQEVHAAKGSARLLHLGLQRSMLAVGEVFEESELMAFLHDAGDGRVRQTMLLYPDTADDAVPVKVPDASFFSDELSKSGCVRLVILDATWRKSRKMLYLNPLLRALPRLSLTDVPPSRYRIRKAHRAGQLSTLEAACHALAVLENDEVKYLPLLEAFDGFVAQQEVWFRRERE